MKSNEGEEIQRREKISRIEEDIFLQFDNEKALTIYNQRISLNPDSKGDLIARGELKLELKEYNEAAQDFNRAIELDSNCKEAFLLYAKAKYMLRDYEGSLLSLDKAIEIDSNDAQAYFNRGLVKRMLINFLSAKDDLNLALEINPKICDASDEIQKESKDIPFELTGHENDLFEFQTIGIRNLCLSNGKDIAIHYFTKIIELSPNDKYAYYYRGIAIFERGGPNLNDFDKVIEIDPKFIWAYIYRGLTRKHHSLNGNLSGALQDFNKATDLNLTDPAVSLRLGIIYSSMKEYGKAMQNFDQLIFLSPNTDSEFEYEATGYYERGRVKLHCGDFRGATQDYDKALKIKTEIESFKDYVARTF